MKSLRRKAVLLAVTALAATSLTTSAAAVPGDDYAPGEDTKVTKTGILDAEAAEEYWTANRLAKTEGDDGVDDSAPSAAEKPLTPQPHDRLGYGRPKQPYAAHYGTRQTGKVSFLVKGESNNCSGTVIGGDMVLTAAHCVVDNDKGGELFDKIAFTPDYHEGNDDDPFGTWGVEQAYIPTAYVERTQAEKDFGASDVAILRLAKDGQGASVGDVIGNPVKPKVSKAGAPDIAATYGYPAQGGTKFTAAEMFYCVSEINESKEPEGEITQFEAPGCAVQGGNSGGPIFDRNWNVIGVTQARASVETDGETDVTAKSIYTRLHPENFSRMLKEAKADVQ